MDIGLIHQFETGYEEGARAVNPKHPRHPELRRRHRRAWNNPGKGKELALAQIGKGADVIFTAAGNSGLGVFRRRRAAGTERTATHFVIGVDSNQNWVKPGFVLTSMVKRVDNAVYDIVKDVVNDTFQGRLPRLRPGERRRRLSHGRVQQRSDSARSDSAKSKRPRQKIIARRDQSHGRDGEVRFRMTVTCVADPQCSSYDNITKRFGDVLANDHVNITVKPGTIHAIVGENGAGKSTAMRIAYGFYTADSGEIVVDGQVRGIATPHDAIALGIGMVHQHFMLVETDDRGREHRPRRRARPALRARSRTAPRPTSASSPKSSSWPSIPTRRSSTCPSASSSGSSC